MKQDDDDDDDDVDDMGRGMPIDSNRWSRF